MPTATSACDSSIEVSREAQAWRRRARVERGRETSTQLLQPLQNSYGVEPAQLVPCVRHALELLEEVRRVGADADAVDDDESVQLQEPAPAFELADHHLGGAGAVEEHDPHRVGPAGRG